MSKRSAEQALRDELEDASTALTRAKARQATAGEAVTTATERRKAADGLVREEDERYQRAKRALEVLVPLGVEEARTDGAS